MLSNINEIDDTLCTGCGGCAVTCPKEAISIIRGKDGFYKPEVDNQTCISCGLCKKVCYKFIDRDKKYNNIANSKRYLSFTKNDEIRKKSSSGGIAQEINLYALENGFNVCGVEYDYDNNNARHIIVNNKDELKKIMGSKYIPSYTLEAFKNLDKNNKYVVFGTPCQIYALRKIIQERNIENLFLVDIFCHGTPSLNLWDKYLDMQNESSNNKLQYINFRDKCMGWHKYSVILKYEDKEYRNIFNKDIFMQCFLNDLDLNEPCYNCKLRFDRIYSDIRLGDFWGPKCKDDNLGSSIVLVNTKKGEELFNSISNIYKEEVSYDELIISQFKGISNIPRERVKFQEDLLSSMSMDQIYRKYIFPINKKKRINYVIKYPVRKTKGLVKRGMKWIKRV